VLQRPNDGCRVHDIGCKGFGNYGLVHAFFTCLTTNLELVLEHGPDSYGRQQWGILVNGRKPEPATPRE